MNIWKPIAIGSIGYILGSKNSTTSTYYRSGRRYVPSLKGDIIDILSGKLYQFVYGETRDETDQRLREKRMQNYGRPVSYAPVYNSEPKQEDDEDSEGF